MSKPSGCILAESIGRTVGIPCRLSTLNGRFNPHSLRHAAARNGLTNEGNLTAVAPSSVTAVHRLLQKDIIAHEWPH